MSDIQLIERDPGLPGLGLVLDLEALSARLRVSTGLEIRSSTATYLKYKPGTSCLAGYEIDAGDVVVNLYAKAYATTRSLNADPRGSSPLGFERWVWPECGVAVRVFPNDAKLRHLRRLVDDEARHGLLRAALAQNPELWDSRVRRLRYKPERRYVGELFGREGHQGSLRLFDEPGYQNAKGGAAIQENGLGRSPRLLGCSETHRALVTEWRFGECLTRLIEAPQPDYQPVALAGAALAELHRQAPNAALRSLAVERQAALSSIAAAVAFICPSLGDRIRKLAARAVIGLDDRSTYDHPVHGDFYSDQILWDGHDVTILDWDEAGRGDPHGDVGNFVAHLERWAASSRFPAARIPPIRDALLDGYASACPNPPSASEIDFHTGVGLLRLALDPFRRREPDWPASTEKLLEAAELVLARSASA